MGYIEKEIIIDKNNAKELASGEGVCVRLIEPLFVAKRRDIQYEVPDYMFFKDGNAYITDKYVLRLHFSEWNGRVSLDNNEIESLLPIKVKFFLENPLTN